MLHRVKRYREKCYRVKCLRVKCLSPVKKSLKEFGAITCRIPPVMEFMTQHPQEGGDSFILENTIVCGEKQTIELILK